MGPRGGSIDYENECGGGCDGGCECVGEEVRWGIVVAHHSIYLW